MPTPQQLPLYSPTPAEIRAACEAIRAEWTEQERLRRAGGQRARSGPRVVRAWIEFPEPIGE